MGGFRRTRRGIEVRLDRVEATLLGRMLDDLAMLLGERDAAGEPTTSGVPAADELAALTELPTAAPIPPPTDPVLARLLPDGYRDDPAAAAELRRLTEGELRAGKQAAVATVRAQLPTHGGRVVLDEDDAQSWLAALNDLRLAVGTRLEVTQDSYDELDRLARGDPRRQALSVFGWLGTLEETLVEALAGW